MSNKFVVENTGNIGLVEENLTIIPYIRTFTKIIKSNKKQWWHTETDWGKCFPKELVLWIGKWGKWSYSHERERWKGCGAYESREQRAIIKSYGRFWFVICNKRNPLVQQVCPIIFWFRSIRCQERSIHKRGLFLPLLEGNVPKRFLSHFLTTHHRLQGFWHLKVHPLYLWMKTN